MRFKVLSEWMARQYECDEPHVFVSIRGPDGEPAPLPDNPNRLALLRLSFHDLEGTASDLRHAAINDPVLFSPEQASQVVDLVQAHPEAQCLVVNCEAGVSRSAAIAAAVARVKNEDDEEFFARYFPNRRVYGMLIKEFARRGLYPPTRGPTRVIHVRDAPPRWRLDPAFVYVGRPRHGLEGPFGNPFPVERHGRDRCIALFEEHLRDRIKSDEEFKRKVRELSSKTLVCFCKPRPCHGDVLARIADELAKENRA